MASHAVAHPDPASFPEPARPRPSQAIDNSVAATSSKVEKETSARKKKEAIQKKAAKAGRPDPEDY